MSTYHSRIQLKKDIRKISISAKQMEETFSHSNISLLRPSDRKRSETGEFSHQRLTRELTDKLILIFALYQDFKTSNDRVSYCLNKRVLLEIADEMIEDWGETHCTIELMHERRCELEALFRHLDQLAKTKSNTHLLIADHDFRSWFTNPNWLIADSEPLLFDPIPWSVEIDEDEFLLTRTQTVAAEQFTTIH